MCASKLLMLVWHKENTYLPENQASIFFFKGFRNIMIDKMQIGIFLIKWDAIIMYCHHTNGTCQTFRMS